MSTRSTIESVRRFNRFWTGRIGVLRKGYLGTRRSLAETRILFEIGHRDGPAAGELCAALGIDPGYMSRILGSLGREGLVRRSPSPTDGRRTHLALTPSGARVLAVLDARSRKEVAKMLAGVPAAAVRRIVEALGEVGHLLGEGPVDGPATLRPAEPGDLGWIVERHGDLYARERGWGAPFEGIVAAAAAEFLAGHDPRRERCWIAEAGGARVGSVLLVARNRTTAKLRLLLVEPRARGRGIGRLLVGECVDFARRAGYRRVELWTHAGLLEARRLYRRAGFRLVRKEGRLHVGAPLDGETWALDLGR